MAPRLTDHNQSQGAFVSVHFDRQFQAGSCEHASNFLVDNKRDLGIFHNKYNNRTPAASPTSAPAPSPAPTLSPVPPKQ